MENKVRLKEGVHEAGWYKLDSNDSKYSIKKTSRRLIERVYYWDGETLYLYPNGKLVADPERHWNPRLLRE